MYRTLILALVLVGCTVDDPHGVASSEIGVPPECIVDCPPPAPTFSHVTSIAPTAGYGTGNLLLTGNALVFQGTQLAVWTVPVQASVGDVLMKLRVSIKGNASDTVEVQVSGRNPRDNKTIVPIGATKNVLAAIGWWDYDLDFTDTTVGEGEWWAISFVGAGSSLAVGRLAVTFGR